MNRRLLVACLVLLAAAATGCSSWPVIARARSALGLGGGGPAFTEEDLRSDLALYAARFRATVVAAADQISQESTDVEIRRRALLWKIRMVPLADQAAFITDPEFSYLAIFTVATAQHEYLVHGVGQDLFGPQQPVAVAASEELLEAAARIGTRFLPEAQRLRLEEQVRRVAQEHPIRGVFVPETVQGVVSAIEPGGSFDWVINFPLAPFRALQGVDSGAQAIRDFNVTAQRFGQVVADMPQSMRWHAELLAFELEQRPTVSSARASLEELAASSTTFSRSIEALPQSLREQASALIQQVESSQGELRKTLAEARGLIGDASGSGATLQPLADSLERTAAQVQQAGVAWAAVVEELRNASPAPSGGEMRPFDVLEYERTAVQITSAAEELRGLLADLHGLDPVLDRVEGGGRALVNLAAWRLFELLLVFFTLLFLYRRVEARLVARRDSGAESR
jgi:hypothetical protein